MLLCCASLNSIFLGKSSFKAAFGSVELCETGSLDGGVAVTCPAKSLILMKLGVIKAQLQFALL